MYPTLALVLSPLGRLQVCLPIQLLIRVWFCLSPHVDEAAGLGVNLPFTFQELDHWHHMMPCQAVSLFLISVFLSISLPM